MRCKLFLWRALVVAPLLIGMVFFVGATAQAFESLGVGDLSLVGGDLTDPEDDGDPEMDIGYNAIFDANHEPGFGSENADPASAGNGESAFNVFDNLLGPANDKWCCGIPGGIPEDEGIWVSATFDQPYLLTEFTVSSANDVPQRDPWNWAVQGSNDGENFTDIYTYDDISPWIDRLEVLLFSAPDDFPVQTTGYSTFRFITYDTQYNGSNAAYFQVGELEFFGEPGGGNALQAGDANMDYEFNQLDLVQVQIAAKYLTGQPATWGEGDWDGAPGGSPGNPPQGDGVFSQVDIIAALTGGFYLKGPYNALAAAGEGDGNASITYDPTTGEVGVQAGATELTSINIDSAAAIFTGDPAQNLGGSFDNDADNNIFKATFGGSFGSLSFGNVAQTGLSEDFVRNDLTAVGSLLGGGDLGAVDLIYVPEPSTIMLLGLGLAGALMMRRRR